MSAADPDLDLVAVDPGLAEELPGLRAVSAVVPGAHGRTPRGLAARLRDLSDRWTGARAVTMRREPVPHAYRVLFRHLGLDPDEQLTPVEQAVRDRLVRGRFGTGDGLHDALLVAVVETGVPVLALDAAAVGPDLELRPARSGEQLGDGPYAHDLPPGRVVLADDRRPAAVLFGDLAPAAVPRPGAAALRLVAVRAPGVPGLHVEEAVWTAADALSTVAAGG